MIALMKDRPIVRRRMVATDFKRDHVGELLLKHPDFDPRVPTAVVYEGCSMYFPEEENREVLRAISQVLEHPDSRLWCDMVKTSVVNGTTNIEEIAKFVAGMDQLGESFVFGCDSPAIFLADCGYSTTRVTLAQDYLGSPAPKLLDLPVRRLEGVAAGMPHVTTSTVLIDKTERIDLIGR